jgi:hypothetical protein
MRIVTLLFMATNLFVTTLTASEAVLPIGFTPLFDGKSLDGWWGCGTEDPRKWMALSVADLEQRQNASRADIAKHWRVENGELINDGKGLYLTTNRLYGDIELRLEYRTEARADSGIYLRGCPQVQIWDWTDAEKFARGGDKGSGGLWNNSPGAAGKDPLLRADRPFGEWNQVRVIQLGSRTWVWLNNQAVVTGAIMENYFDRKRPIPASGPIQLQTHGGMIRWRNLGVREIPSTEANELLRARVPDTYTSIFNGQDFTGWQGALDNYRIEEGAVICQTGKVGNIWTKESYGDFSVRLEFKLPPGGNNGLAIRYSGEGRASYDAMCELQILDDTDAQYAKLDPRHYTGSAYGMLASHRGYLRPLGSWNYQEVTVKGSTIRVELNGTVILDGDLAPVTEFEANKPHPGKDRLHGFFGFTGHNDPVSFRNIAIKRSE